MTYYVSSGTLNLTKPKPEGLIVLLCARSSDKEFQTMGPCTVNARRPTVDSQCRGTTIICCIADLRRCLPTTSVTVDTVLRSLAMPASVHDDTKLVRGEKFPTSNGGKSETILVVSTLPTRNTDFPYPRETLHWLKSQTLSAGVTG